ncbi:uncharacterized protein LOC131046418 [Cryptomeria japonica]|uniref:uncharacterized protein LOC131046418 n=1 Tax=Cryptomeria japonica TaxID=3369 RepID=UPI0027DA8BF9|nr:uncharacterized protein LOC131046418 [Cryptomeria japonica]
MNSHEGLATNRAPLFDGSNYAFLSVQMRAYLMSLGFDVWQSVVFGYTIPTNPPTDVNGEKDFENNEKAMNAILCGLPEIEFVKLMHCNSTHDIWEKLQKTYEGDDKGLEEKVEESTIVKKKLRSLPLSFDAKVPAIEEMIELDKLTIDKLHGIVTTYEMMTNFDSSSKREATFKSLKKGKYREYVSSESSDEEFDSNEAHFMRRLKKGSSKYKLNFHMKKVRIETMKKSLSSTRTSIREKRISLRNTKRVSIKEESCSFDVSDEESSNEEILFMVIEDIHIENQEDEDFFDEGEVNFEEELISALSEIKRLRKKNQNLKFLLQEENEVKAKTSQALEEVEKLIGDLKFQVEEANKIEEKIRNQLKFKDENCERLEAEIVSLRKLDKSST